MCVNAFGVAMFNKLFNFIDFIAFELPFLNRTVDLIILLLVYWKRQDLFFTGWLLIHSTLTPFMTICVCESIFREMYTFLVHLVISRDNADGTTRHSFSMNQNDLWCLVCMNVGFEKVFLDCDLSWEYQVTTISSLTKSVTHFAHKPQTMAV